MKPKVSIIMGSISDWECMKEAYSVLKEFEVECDVRVISAHRTPDLIYEFAKRVRDVGVDVIIAGAGGAAHLPGIIASLTTIPVVGVPIPSKHMNGLDSLYSIVQMPAGVPVATVGIGNATNAGLLAVQVLALKHPELEKKLEDYREKLKEKVHQMNQKLDNLIQPLG
ncbi:MAG: 5-(carboxyamino)imidazole ribonucleotide mutase [Aquificaceae bacterium]